jgi:ABC-2 type transport system permease protein
MIVLLATFVSELRTILTRKQVMMVLLLGPFVYALFYPQPYISEALRDVPVIVVDQDGSTTSRDLVRSLDATPDVAVIDRAGDFGGARDRVYTREAYGVLVVPADFERDLLHGRQASVVLFADSSYFLIFQRLSTAVRAVAQTAGVSIEVARLVGAGVDPSAAMTLADPMPVTLVPLFNPQGGYATYVLPASFVLIVQQILLMGIGMTEQRAYAANHPVHRRSVAAALGLAVVEVAGRMLAFLAIEAVIMPFYLIVLPRLYGLPRLGGIGDILILIAPFAIAVCGLGLAIAATLRSSLACQLVMAALGMPLFFLAGFAWPMDEMPALVYAVAKAIPSTTAIDAFVRLSQFGAGWADIAVQWHRLLVLATVYVALAVVAVAGHHHRRGRAVVAPEKLV